MEINQIADQIQKKIKEIEVLRTQIRNYAKDKADAISRYDKEMAKITIRLKNGEALALDDKRIENPPATIIERIAKGYCYAEKFDMELAEANYKGVITAIHALESELNGYQSIFRYLDTEA